MIRTSTLPLIVLLAAVAAPLATAAEQLEPGLSVSLIEDGLWMYRSEKDWGDGKPITANGLFVIGETSIAMLDTAWTDEQTAGLIDWAEERFGLPVKHVFATHWHWDRMGGMAEVNQRGITGYALERSAELGLENDIESPVVTFTTSVRVDLGDETIEAFYPGWGHTEDNTVVWLEGRRVLHGGCLIKGANSKGMGYIDEADLAAWPGSLDRVVERYPDARLVVPGHGDVGALSLVEHTRMLIERAGDADRH